MFHRIAITEAQIHEYRLPTRPVKTTDRRAKGWQGECVELDTMLPADIQSIVHDNITRHIDEREWQLLQQTEAMERETLNTMLEKWAA